MRKRTRKDRYTDAPPELAESILSAVEVVDDFPPPEELRRQLKRSVTLRLDPDVYQWFRKPGSGYQTRINMVLRAYMLSNISNMKRVQRGGKQKKSLKGRAIRR